MADDSQVAQASMTGLAGESLPPEEDMSMEALYNEAIDNQQVDSAKVSLLDPPGSYLSIPKMTAVLNTNKDTGRKGIVVTGMGTLIELDGRATDVQKALAESKGGVGVAKARIRFMFSWVYVEHSKNKGQPDFQYKNYIAARDAYTQMFGMRPESIGQIAEYLTDHMAKYRISQVGVPTESNPNPDGDPGTLTMGVYAVKG